MTHFAIHFGDNDRAKNFYDGFIEWGFEPYGQNDISQIKADKTGSGALIGALQSRKYSPFLEKLIGLECTIGIAHFDNIP